MTGLMRFTPQLCWPISLAISGYDCTKQVSKSMAWLSGSLAERRYGGVRQRVRGLEDPGGQDVLRSGNQRIDAAMQAIDCDGVLQQAPDPLNRVVLVGTVL